MLRKVIARNEQETNMEEEMVQSISVLNRLCAGFAKRSSFSVDLTHFSIAHRMLSFVLDLFMDDSKQRLFCAHQACANAASRCKAMLQTDILFSN